LFVKFYQEGFVMKPQPIDRLLTIFLGFDLLLAFWWLALAFPVHTQVAVNVF
jgi:hypothetical protein